jgi:hypothetical protein
LTPCLGGLYALTCSSRQHLQLQQQQQQQDTILSLDLLRRGGAGAGKQSIPLNSSVEEVYLLVLCILMLVQDVTVAGMMCRTPLSAPPAWYRDRHLLDVSLNSSLGLFISFYTFSAKFKNFLQFLFCLINACLFSLFCFVNPRQR